MKKRLAPMAVVSALVAVLCLCFGCSTVRSVSHIFTAKEPVLAKRVKVLTFIDQTHLGAHLGAEITSRFVSGLQKTPHISLDENSFGLPMPTDVQSPQYGFITPKAFIQRAGALGLNILITGVINPVEVTFKRTGIWPFRKNSRVYGISLVVNVVDVDSGALLYTRLESRKVTRHIQEDYGVDERQLMLELVREKLPGILKSEINGISERLEGIPWTGKILSVEDGITRIDGGQDVGVKQGYVFRVFSRGKVIQSESGMSYPVRGSKAGTIEVTSVGEKDAEAKTVSGGPFEAGQTIRLED